MQRPKGQRCSGTRDIRKAFGVGKPESTEHFSHIQRVTLSTCAQARKRPLMLVFRHVSRAFLTLSLLGGVAMSAHARPLTQAEQIVCPKLSTCLDIVERHDATEFDYTVLEKEFARFGDKGRARLFSVLEGESGSADIARLIARGGPLSPNEAAWLDRTWTPETVETLLPLVEDGSVRSRDLLLRAATTVKGGTQRAVLRRLEALPDTVKRVPLNTNLQASVLAAALASPSSSLAPFVQAIDPRQNRAGLERLLLSGDAEMAGAAYAALYRTGPGPAFQALLAQMRRLERLDQAEAIGDMLAARHMRRADGFYARFASDISGDEDFPPLARAAGLHAYFGALAAEKSVLPEPPAYTADVKSGLEALMSGKRRDHHSYAHRLAKIDHPNAAVLMGAIWATALEKDVSVPIAVMRKANTVPNREQLLRRQLQSDGVGNLYAAVSYLESAPEPAFTSLLSQIAATHPLTEVRASATKAMGRPFVAGAVGSKACRLPRAFDVQDITQQMPFFDDSLRKGATVTQRKYLASAHPTPQGWLAGYDGGEFYRGLLYFDNASGKAEVIDLDGPSNVVALLPDRPLKLGQTTGTFWGVNWSNHMIARGYVHRVTNAGGTWVSRRVTPLLRQPSDFAVTARGDLILRFESQSDRPGQPPLRISPDGNLSLACPPAPIPAATQINP
jgi:hypothetical protein